MSFAFVSGILEDDEVIYIKAVATRLGTRAWGMVLLPAHIPIEN